VLSPSSLLIPIVAAGSLFFLAILGYLGAKTGGAAILTPIVRVTFWGALAMAVTAGIGAIVGTVV
jgi:VIT1/CCC1 family predicted Fe2+/Mn2+ transporter